MIKSVNLKDEANSVSELFQYKQRIVSVQKSGNAQQPYAECFAGGGQNS